MKSLTLLIFAVGCTMAFGQAMSTSMNTNQNRDYASNAVPVAYMVSPEALNVNAPAVAQDFEGLLGKSNNPGSKDQSIESIKAMLENRLALLDNATDPTTEITLN
ncbi:MAG: hypothetical protein ACI865_003069 [Flavobacteriaceae bacterium]|jgi:hypothetical protein